MNTLNDMKLLICGDTHGDTDFVTGLLNTAREQHALTVVQLGDFGFDFGKALLDAICEWLDEDAERRFIWLDGNHDQHDYIEEVILNGYDLTEPVPHFHERLLYAPRGSATVIGGKKCLFLGGAFSIDKDWRKPHVSWWPQEMIRPADIERAIAHDGIDVMFCHDSPPNAQLDPLLYEGRGYKVDRDSVNNREMVAHVVELVQPQVLFHGHYHHRYTGTYIGDNGWRTLIEGLGANFHPQNSKLDSQVFLNENVLVRNF